MKLTPRGTAILSMTTAMAFTAGAAAQLEPAQPQQQDDPFAQQLEQQEEPAAVEEEGQLVKAREVREWQVQDEQGEGIGQLEELGIDTEQGVAAYGILELDEPIEQDEAEEAADPDEDEQWFWEDDDAEADRFAVPWEAFEVQADEEALTLTIDRQQLAELEPFDDDWDQLGDEQFATQQHEVFGFAPYWEEEEPEQPEPQADEVEQEIEQALTDAGVEPQEAEEQARELAERFVEERPDREQLHRQLEDAMTEAGVDEQQARDEAERLSEELHEQLDQEQLERPLEQQQEHRDEHHEQREQQEQLEEPALEDAPRQLTVEPFDEVRGREVINFEDEDLAELEDLLIDTRQGHLAYAILEYGGFLGIGDEQVAVPYHTIEVEEDRFVLDADEQMLDQLAYDADEEPDFTDEQWAQQTHETFDEEPYWEVYGYGPPGEPQPEQEEIEQRDEQRTY